MKKPNELNRLLLLVLAFMIVILVGLLSVDRPSLQYTDDLTGALSKTRQHPLLYAANTLQEMDNPAASGVLLVDIRPGYEFDKQHLSGALNIPVHVLLDKKGLQMLRDLDKEGTDIVLYGDDQQDAVGPWMLLKQLGLQRVYVLQGGYRAWLNRDTLAPPSPDSFSELPRYDYEAIMTRVRDESGLAPSIARDVAAPQPEKLAPVKRKKQSVTEGGC